MCATTTRSEDQAVISSQGYFIGSGICSATDIQFSVLVMAGVRKFLTTTGTAISAHTCPYNNAQPLQPPRPRREPESILSPSSASDRMPPHRTVRILTYAHLISALVTVTILIKFVPTTPGAHHDNATPSFLSPLFHQIPTRTITLGALYNGLTSQDISGQSS